MPCSFHYKTQQERPVARRMYYSGKDELELWRWEELMNNEYRRASQSGKKGVMIITFFTGGQ